MIRPSSPSPSSPSPSAGFGQAPALAQTAAPAAAPATSPAGQQLRALFTRSDEANLERNPIGGLFRGDPRYQDRLGDIFADSYYVAERKAAEDELAALAKIDRNALTPEEQVSYDVFKWTRTLDLRGLRVADRRGLQGAADRPLQRAPRPVRRAELRRGRGALQDGEGLRERAEAARRLRGRRSTAPSDQMRKGMAAGVVQPKLVMVNVGEQLDAMVADGRRGQRLLQAGDQVPRRHPGRRPGAAEGRLRGLGAHQGRCRRSPGCATSSRPTTCPRRATASGLRDMKGGPELYRYLVEVNTTTKTDPEQIHQIGLDEVTRLHAEMEKVKAQVGFKGTLQRVLRAHPHRPEVQAGIARVADRAVQGDRQAGRRDPAASCSPPCPRPRSTSARCRR